MKYHITNLFDGTVQGTDNEEKAASLAFCEEFFVSDTETHEWLQGDERFPIENLDK